MNQSIRSLTSIGAPGHLSGRPSGMASIRAPSAGRLNTSRTPSSGRRSSGSGRPSANRSVVVGNSQNLMRTKGSRGAVLPNAANIPNRFPENPPAEQKLRLVFEELDLKNIRAITHDGFRRVLKALNIEFTGATTDDLFERMDVNGTKSVSYPEYLNWAAYYPNLIDAIYDRSRNAVEKIRLEAEVEAKRSGMESLSSHERNANAQWQEITKDLKSQERVVASLAQDIEARKSEEKMRNRDVMEAEKEADFARTERDTKEKDYLASKEAEREAFAPLSQAASAVAKAERQIDAFENDLVTVQEKERQLQSMLTEVKRDAEKIQEAIGEAQIELSRVQEFEEEVKAVHEDAVADVQEHYQLLQQAEQELSRYQDNINMAVSNQQAAIAVTKEAILDFEEEKKLLPTLREQEEAIRKTHAASARALEAHDEEVRLMEQQVTEFCTRRLEIEEDEHPLLEHEVRLREQRFNLDDRDDTHWEETGKFMSFTGRGDTRSQVVSQNPGRL